MNTIFSRAGTFFQELRRRRVFRVAVVYAGLAFIIFQVADFTFPALHVPEWFSSAMVIVLLVGFPIAVGLAWAFDITDKRVVRTPSLKTPPTPTPLTEPDPAKRAGPEAKPASSIAVLPFINMSADPENEYFCDGMAEELINALTKIKDLRVAARTSAFSFKGKELDIREVGLKLNVETVLEGSVRKADNRLRVTAQLVNVADGYHRWSERYDRELKDIFDIQDDITENIVRALQVMLSPKEKQALEKVPATDVKAYDVYLRGRKFFNQFHHKSLEFALQMFNRAIQLDPSYALAYAGIADCHSLFYMYWESTEKNLRKAEEASRKALELDPDLAEAHVARGLAVSLIKRYNEAEKAFETALQLNPRLFEGHYFYARTCLQQGKLEKAARLFEQACEVRPEDYQAPLFMGQVHNGLGQREKAEVAHRRTLEIIERHLELNPDDVRAVYLGAGAHIRLGDRDQGLEWASRALRMDPEDPTTHYNVACSYSLAGEVEKALDCLEKSVTGGMGQKEWIENDSDLDPLRSHPRFQKLMAQLK